MSPLSSSPAWQALAAHRDALAGQHLADLWKEDAGRGERFTFPCAGLAVDFSKQRITGDTLGLLIALAKERGLPEAIEWDPLESTCRHASLSIL